MLHKAPKSKWVSFLILFNKLVGIRAFASTASVGGTYYPVCIWLVSGIWIPRTLRVGKVGMKVGLSGPLVQDLCYKI